MSDIWLSDSVPTQLLAMDNQSDLPSNYKLSEKLAEYMHQWFCFLAFPGPESPQPAPLLDILVNQTIAIHQMVAKLAEAYWNQSEYATSSLTVRVQYYIFSSLRY